MTNKNQVQFKKLKKNHVGLSICLNILIFMFAAILIVLVSSYVIYSTVQTRLIDEYEQLFAMTRLYDLCLTDGEKRALDILDSTGRDYFILDKDGNILHQYGENTCSMDGGMLDLYSASVVAYRDTEQDLLFDQDNGKVIIDSKQILKTIWNKMLAYEEDNERDYVSFGIGLKDGFTEETDPEEEGLGYWNLEIISSDEMEMIEEWDEKLFQFPMWFSVPMDEEGKQLVGKVTYRASIVDSSLLFVMVMVLIILVVMIMILKVVNLIRDFLRQKRVVNLYLTDPITRGHNWMWFLLRAEPYLRLHRNARKNFAVVEILFIKYRNFCVCHSIEEGEKILVAVYKTLEKSLGHQEMCAHVTTDTFALLLQFENREELRERLCSLMEKLENIDGTHKFAFHFGVKLIPEMQNKNGRVVRRKDLLLENEFNNAGTATASLEDSDDSRIAYFDEKLLEEQKWLDAVEEHQQAAVEREEFKVYYQPKYDPKTGKLRGAEALIRWDSPELGFISPGRFIPIFEKNGFITEIDHYMISHVARDQKSWLDQGLSCVPVSVNVSRAHFIERDLANQICAMVDEAGAPHYLIEIELTESAFFDDKNAMIDTILKLKEAGFAVSMDDFGSGYSSLNSLKDMPLDVLKLDAEFFRGRDAGERGEIVVSEAIKLAQSLNMKTVAEGVEEKDQVDFLARNGCDMIQGYYFAKPMPRDDFLERIKAGYSEKAEQGSDPQEGTQTADEPVENEPQQ